MMIMVRPRLRVKALLFDLDGTLVDSTRAYEAAGKAGFTAIGLSHSSIKTALEVAKQLEQGLTIDSAFAKLRLDHASLERFLSAYLNAYYSTVLLKSKSFPNVKETLQTLSQRFPLALITLRYVLRDQIIEELKRLGLKKYFKAVVTALDVEKPKPSPDALLMAAEKLGVPINKCVIVGDSIADIQAGKSAGAKTVAVLSGLFSRKELEKEKPDLIIKDIKPLLKFLCY
jgi:HAD superfamily hydrolase (TIGR01509 family)